MALNETTRTLQISEEEYLKSELISEFKREYIDGHVYAMAGAGYNHNCISGNISSNFINHLKGTSCTTFIADMRVRLGKDYVYPDVLVDCGEMKGNDYISTTPMIIIEVLSKSTRKKDTTQKLLRYINTPSLLEYVMIEQDIVSVQVLRKNNNWKPEYYYLSDSVTFSSIDLTLTVEEIYDRVDNNDMREFRQEKFSTQQDKE